MTGLFLCCRGDSRAAAWSVCSAYVLLMVLLWWIAYVQGWLFMSVCACAIGWLSSSVGCPHLLECCVYGLVFSCPAPLQQQQTNFDDGEQDCVMTMRAQALDTQERAPGRCAASNKSSWALPACLDFAAGFCRHPELCGVCVLACLMGARFGCIMGCLCHDGQCSSA